MVGRTNPRRWLSLQRLEDRTVPAIVLNEIYVNPPGIDDNREYVEILSTTGATSLAGLALVEIDGNGAATGTIAQDVHLDGQSTGANGLLMLGRDYATLGATPWGALVSGETELGDKSSLTNNDNCTMLLVSGYVGVTGQDLDADDDGVLDVTPWASVLDSVGWYDSTVPNGRVYTTAVLSQPTLTPDAASRFSNNEAATSAAAWYNGEMLAQGGVPDMTVNYNPASSSSNLPPNGRITPGSSNLASAAPSVAATQVNDGSAQRSRVTSLTVAFNTAVTFAGGVAGAFSLSRNGGGAVLFTATETVVGGATVVTLSDFAGVESQFGSLRDGRFTLTVLADHVSANGAPLDGNGDGVAGDNYSFGESQGLYRFFGDINGDRRVDIADFGMFATTYNRQAGQPGFLAAFDFDGNGRIDIADFGQFSLRYLGVLP